MLSEALNRYQNRTIDAAQVIAEIVDTGRGALNQPRQSHRPAQVLDLRRPPVAEGGPELAEQIDANGYEQFAGAGTR